MVAYEIATRKNSRGPKEENPARDPIMRAGTKSKRQRECPLPLRKMVRKEA